MSQFAGEGEELPPGRRGTGPSYGPGRGRYSPAKSGIPGAEQAPGVPSEESEERPFTTHEEPFPELKDQELGYDKKGPRNPNLDPGRGGYQKVRPIPNVQRPPEGFMLKVLPRFKTYPGVTWHDGKMSTKKGKETTPVFVRVLNEDKLLAGFFALMQNEYKMLRELDSKFILKPIGWYSSRNSDNESLSMTVFPKCDGDLENMCNDRDTPFEVREVIWWMGQIAQALA